MAQVKMDPRSIDQVIQSSNRKSMDLNPRKHSNSASSHETTNRNTAFSAALSRKPSIIDSRAPPSSRSTQPSISTSSSKSVVTERNCRSRTTLSPNGNFTDFFSSEVFQLVLRNPTTAHRFQKFCEKRACGENMEFISQVGNYNRLLDELTRAMSTIEKKFTGPNAENGINISGQDSRAIHNSIKHSVQNVIPSLECIFLDAQEHIETVLMKDVYPRFVKHQLTTSATLAMGSNGSHFGSYQGLGDSIVLTDPLRADNPIIFASDGFIEVTGYTRKEIIPRNCRFLQGPLTDQVAIQRLELAIGSNEETVELLLNYRKNGEPFWNLLYVSPLYDHNNKIAFFFGGQVNCSTTIHGCSDILRILSLPDDEDDTSISDPKPPSIQNDGLHRVKSPKDNTLTPKHRSSFFKSMTGWGDSGDDNLKVLQEPGMEGQLTNKFLQMDTGFEGQLEAFYTAYSKYLILRIAPQTSDLIIAFYSPSMLEFLLLPQVGHHIQSSNPLSRHQRPSSMSLFNRDIFKVLADQPLAATIGKTFKSTVRDAIKHGKAVSVELGMMTGIEEIHKGGRQGSKRVEEKYISHWTVLKDEEGMGKLVVLTIAPR